MQTVFLVFLFILQVIGFYFMALLYMKVSKFNDLEKKQRKLMAEMDDAIGAYLSELKEENERLISIIDKRQENNDSAEKSSVSPRSLESEQPREKEAFFLNTPRYPVKAAMDSYRKAPSLKKMSVPDYGSNESEMDDRTLAIHLHDEGEPIEKIAKRLGKGKTEVELLLKFR
ncbi:hypothetical protein [Sporosarcina sp. UB5]|uniref:hypothetical protein n=1 Tax=Sporosarcina sp. UB5 TaxID=3047463 RepID=UPI003D79C941